MTNAQHQFITLTKSEYYKANPTIDQTELFNFTYRVVETNFWTKNVLRLNMFYVQESKCEYVEIQQ